MIEVKGKGCINAKVIADSISEDGVRITTFELEYHRFIHGELLTHRLLSRNAMSSRAVPVANMIEQVRTNPAMPIHWGAHQKGMQAETECDKNLYLNKVYPGDPNDPHDHDFWGGDEFTRKGAWEYAAEEACRFAEAFMREGYAKQIVNRLLEPFQIMKTIVTATEYDNFFWLRCHTDAQPEIKELADCMYQCYKESDPELLKAGEWHTPYVEHFDAPHDNSKIAYGIFDKDGREVYLDLETAQKISASCCAQVSFRLNDNSVDKAVMIYNKLVESKPVHASPFEHIATPMDGEYECDIPMDGKSPIMENFEEGTTHMDRNGECWSGNLKGWIQYRQLIKDNVCWEFEGE